MKFGKEIQRLIEEAMPEWKDKFLSYKQLKQQLKLIGSEPQENNMPAFVRLLTREITKFNTFFHDKDEEFVIRHQVHRDRANQSMALGNAHLLRIWRDLVVLHGEMVLLANYSSLNYIGLVKILKKHDKLNKSGALLRLPFIQKLLHQPFCRTDELNELIHQCERDMCSILPVDLDLELEGSDPLFLQDCERIKRSTLAALRTIQHLRRGSSTYGPSSLPYHTFDDDRLSIPLSIVSN